VRRRSYVLLHVEDVEHGRQTQSISVRTILDMNIQIAAYNGGTVKPHQRLEHRCQLVKEETGRSSGAGSVDSQ